MEVVGAELQRLLLLVVLADGDLLAAVPDRINAFDMQAKVLRVDAQFLLLR